VPTDITVELPVASWAPVGVAPADRPPSDVLFVDGVRRVEARVWVSDADGFSVHQGICASYAAGVVRCNSHARVVAAQVERRLFCTGPDVERIETRHGDFEAVSVAGEGPDALSLAMQRKMGELEVELARRALGPDVAPDAIVVVDGPLRQHGHLPGTVGSIKTQHRAYGPPVVLETVARLGAGERTPVFVVGDVFARYSWYLRLAGPITHPLAGIVRCEAATDLPTRDAIALADRITRCLPRFASEPHKDPRAPQNLYPIAGLERELRRRLGDPGLLLRALRVAAA
jgi:hypothetical protein